MRRTLVVMAKAPVPGRVKTLLCPPLDLDSAARLHQAFLLDMLETASAVPDTELIVCYGPTGTLPFFRTIAPRAHGYMLQKGSSVSVRILRCFDRLLEPDRAVVLIGVDSPTLPARSLELAFDALTAGDVDLVLGPSEGGTYHLIGLTVDRPELFEGINWNTTGIPNKTIERAAKLGLDWYLLPEWYEVRRPKDLYRLRDELLSSGGDGNHARHTRHAISALRGCNII